MLPQSISVAVPPSLLAQADRTTVERRFEFAALPEGWMAVAGLAAIVLVCWTVVWLYRTEGRRGASVATRMVLAFLRCMVFGGLAAILVEPVLATYLHRWVDSYCIVLIDDSSSMDLQDHYRNEADANRVRAVMPPETPMPLRRTDVVKRLLTRDNNKLLDDLTARNRIKVYKFSDAPELIETLHADREGNTSPEETPAPTPTASEAAIASQLTAQGPSTNLSRALQRSIESLGGAPLAGVVVLTDGGMNQGDPPDVLGRYLEEQGISLRIVGVGDASPPKNIRVSEITAPENAFKNDPFTITANLAAQGMTGESITVQLFEDAAGGASASPVDTRVIAVPADGAIEPIIFNRKRESLGRTVYRVAVPVAADESVSDDNAKQTVVNVIDDSVRVLLIAGEPSWEYRYLSRLLTRDATFNVSCWLQSADTHAVRDGDTIIESLPTDPEQLFAYDAVILMNPDPSEFGPGWAKMVEDLVNEHGGGLAYLSARQHTPQFMRDPAVRRIVQMLPVSLDPEADLILNRIGHFQTRDWPIEVPEEAFTHPILRGGADIAAAKEKWKNLTGVFWHYPVLREKPVATVLMRHGNPQMRNSYGGHVLLATQFAGAGRSAFMAFDGSWRWRKNGEQIHNEFWVQMIRYLVEGKLLGAKKRATLLTEGDTFQLGGTVNVMARLFDARFEPYEMDPVRGEYRLGPRKGDFTLKRLADRPGWYEGKFTPDQTGTYELSVTLPGASGTDAVTTTHSLQIVRPNIEIMNPQMNRAALAALAQRSPGGQYYEVDETDRLAESIPDRHEMMTVKSRPIQLWDRWWTLAALAGLLSVEWAVRKWVRLL